MRYSHSKSPKVDPFDPTASLVHGKILEYALLENDEKVKERVAADAIEMGRRRRVIHDSIDVLRLKLRNGSKLALPVYDKGRIGEGAYSNITKAIGLLSGWQLALTRSKIDFQLIGDVQDHAASVVFSSEEEKEAFCLKSSMKVRARLTHLLVDKGLVVYRGSGILNRDSNLRFRLVECSDYVPGEDLESFLGKNRNNPAFGLRNRVSIISDPACGLSALHERGIFHRDFMKRNIYVTLPYNDDPYTGKLGDFGLLADVATGRYQSGILHPFVENENCSNDIIGQVLKIGDLYDLGEVILELLDGGFHRKSSGETSSKSDSSEVIPFEKLLRKMQDPAAGKIEVEFRDDPVWRGDLKLTELTKAKYYLRTLISKLLDPRKSLEVNVPQEMNHLQKIAKAA